MPSRDVFLFRQLFHNFRRSRSLSSCPATVPKNGTSATNSVAADFALRHGPIGYAVRSA